MHERPACVSLGDNAAGAGHLAFVLLFRNQGSSSCEVESTPRVIGLDANGTTVGSVEYATGKRSRVTVMPGRVASSDIDSDDVETNGAVCLTYAALEVTPPGGTSTQVIELRWTMGQGPLLGPGLYVCAPLSVGPLVSGVTAPD